MKNFICSEGFLSIVFAAFIGLILLALLHFGTSKTVWHAGEHTSICDGSENCKCYENLMK